jgi:predicted acylesterase/phospholipase RssA/MinD-like ATPase involved in chromosome partitioning or flagellar assembly
MIYTFYSYKGGVGRSMALANIAESFHEKGLRVVMIDWDLEAPGLETFFCLRGGEKQLAELRAHPGLIDMIVAYKNAHPGFSAQRLKASRAAASPMAVASPQSPADEEERARAAELTRKILKEADVPEFLLHSTGDAPAIPAQTLEQFLDRLYGTTTASISSREVGGTLADSPFRPYLQCVHEPDKEQNGVYLLSAGARSDDKFRNYAVTIQGFGWSEFYAAYEGQEYFSWFRQRLEAIADVVLIDSRTGVTEMGGVCTRHIPDAVIALCAPNFQNVDGVVRVVSGLNKTEVKQARDGRSVQALVVPTRIDNSESDRLNEFSISFAEKVEQGGFVPELLQASDRPLWNLQIPYIPRYNYREERVIGPDTRPPDPATQKLIDAYRRIAIHLAVLAPEGSRLRGVFAGEIQSAFPFLSKVAPQLAPAVSDSWVDRPDEFQALKAELLSASASSRLSRLAVCGWAGTGKTTLVARVCRDPDVVSAHPGGILWLNADRHWIREAAQESLRSMLGVSRQSVEHGLEQALSDRRYLLVVDDVSSLEYVDELFKFGSRCTQVVITRDADVAGQFEGKVVNVGPLTVEQSLKILRTDQVVLAEPGNPRVEIARELLTLPLGATLVRSALDRRLSQGATLPQACEQLRGAFERHDIVAFDQLEKADRSTSIGQSLKETVSRLKPDEEARLVDIAKGLKPQGADETSSASLPIQVQRLMSLGLVDLRSGQVSVHPLVLAYLLVEGRLDERLENRARTAQVSSSADKAAQQAGTGEANPRVERARQIIRGESASLNEMEKLAERLKEERYFTYARQLFALAQELPETKRQSEGRRLKLIQRQALCTYRDPDLPAESRFDDALALLENADLHTSRPSSETLGLAGALHKYQWKLTGRRRDLERSVSYYGAGAARDVTDDLGYTAINAAFMLDLLAQQEREDVPADAARHVEEARAIRERIVSQLPPFAEKRGSAWVKNQWWFPATLAEACFGLSRFSEARFWLREGLALNPPDWELESTTRQLVTLAIALKLDLSEGSEAHRTLRTIFRDATYAVRGATIGKVGLALSGGGFRASLFHIGVLARMAELDMLRYVEVLSCVSGGSIVGAHYYLEVRRLLQEKPDSAITREDYIEVVRRLEREFLAATQKNLRLRLFAAWFANLRTLLQPGYTRTTHLGWLFEKHIYSRVRDGHSNGRRWLNDLQIKPQGGSPGFNPKVDNWARAAKAPILLLNATTLNTGHNWQFAVSWMGEPPLGASSPVDRNDILRRMYYWEAPLAHRRVALGQAVAASACVPSLFDPVEFKGLYPDRSIRLIDGGTHDNQGIVGLLEQECAVMLVSDASGQTSSENQPSEEILSVGFRTSNILMARVREAEYRELELLRRSSALNGLVFLHLKKDLEAGQVDWVDCQDPIATEISARAAPSTTYGIPRPVQSRLAAMRTDLDSFSDTEAYTLMLSGYRMMTTEVQNSLSHLPFSDGARQPWRFLAVEGVALRTLGKELEHVDLLKQLSVGASQMFKLWKLQPVLKYLVIIVALILAGIAGVDDLRHLLAAFCPSSGVNECGALHGLLGVSASGPPDRNVPWLVVAMTAAAQALLAIAAASILLWLVHRLFRTQKSITVIATGLIMITAGWLVALVHLFPLNWLYLRYGRIKAPAR